MKESKRDRGFSLVEVLASLFLISLGVLAAAPMFVYAMQTNSVGGDFGEISALAVERMEQLRGTNYLLIPPGGSLTSDVASYFDDTNPGVMMRWEITENVAPEDSRTIVLRAWALRPGATTGPQRVVELRTVRAK